MACFTHGTSTLIPLMSNAFTQYPWCTMKYTNYSIPTVALWLRNTWCHFLPYRGLYLHVWAYVLWLFWVVAKQGNCAVGAVVSPKCENSLFLLLYSLGIIKSKYKPTIPTNKFEISYNNLILESPIVVGFVYGFLKPFTLHTMKSAYFMRIQKKHMLPCAPLRGRWWTWTRDCFMVSTT